MEPNVNFRNQLLVEYLNQLVKVGNMLEFNKFYPSVEEYLVSLVSESKDIDVLSMVNSIFAFRKKSLGKQL